MEESNLEQNSPVQPVENQTKAQVPPSAKSKLPWMLIIIFVLLVVLGSGTYFLIKSSNLKSQNSNLQLKSQNLSPTPVAKISSTPIDETANPNSIGANWKTFSNANFSLKLPIEWAEGTTLNPKQYRNYKVPVIGGGFNSTKDKGKLKIEIYTADNKVITGADQTLKSFVAQEKRNREDNLGSKNFKWTETEITVSGNKAIKVKTDSPGFVVYTVNPLANNVFSIAFGLDFDNYENLASQILSTFRFAN